MVCYFIDEEFGRVLVYTRRGIRNASVRWDGDHLKMVVPAGINGQEVRNALNRLREGIRALKHPVVSFAIGQVVTGFHCQVTIVENTDSTNLFVYGLDDDSHGYLRVPPQADLSTESAKRTVGDGLKWLMERFAAKHLLPFAREVARELGVDLSAEWLSVGRGMRKLGHCTRDGHIQLSRNLMFMPERLIRFVICHELAHLQHHDHSPAFHALVNVYTGGQEAQLEREVKQFAWPILR